MTDAEPIRMVAATEADLAAVSRLAGEIWREHYPPIIGAEQTEYMLTRMYSVESLRRLITEDGHILEQLFVGERLGGYLSYRVGTGSELRLDKLYLHADYRARGLGSLMIKRAESAARKRGCAAIVLNVHQRNVVAVKAYQRNGFVVRRTYANDFGNGRPMDDYEMVKEL